MERRWSASSIAAGIAVVLCGLDGALKRYPDVKAAIALYVGPIVDHLTDLVALFFVLTAILWFLDRILNVRPLLIRVVAALGMVGIVIFGIHLAFPPKPPALTNQGSGGRNPVAESEKTIGNLQSQLTQAQKRNDDLNAQHNADQSTIASLNAKLSASSETASIWQQRYLDLVTRIAGEEFGDQFKRALLVLDFSTAEKKQADSDLAAYQERWEKKEVLHPPMTTRERALEADGRLTDARRNFDPLDAQWKSRLAAAVACVNKK